jgi:hypothetical protein
MTKLTKEEAAQIVARELKGFRMASSSSFSADRDEAPLGASADLGTPDLTELRKKYLTRNADAAPNGLAPMADDDDMIVAVEPENPADPWSRSARPKATVISGSKKTIIGSQG